MRLKKISGNRTCVREPMHCINKRILSLGSNDVSHTSKEVLTVFMNKLK
jgi:hypothetical protein